MALPTSGPLSINQINVEAGNSSGSASSLNDSSIRVLLDPDKGANEKNSISEYRGASREVTFTYEVIGGGGGGGHGFDGGANGTAAPNGTNTAIFKPFYFTVGVSSGAQGGRSGVFHPATNTTAKDGDASHYGAGGARGTNTDPGFGANAPSSSYGAGGGGGGGDLSNNRYDSTGYTGEGGGAATRSAGSYTVLSGETLTVTVGSGGAGAFHGSYKGGNGAGGFARITYGGNNYDFTSSSTITITG